MMTLADHLLATRTPEQLARELAKTAKENAALRDRVGALEHELFWMKVAENARIADLEMEVEDMGAAHAAELLDISLNGGCP